MMPMTNSKIKIAGQSLRSYDKNVLFSATYAVK